MKCLLYTLMVDKQSDKKVRVSYSFLCNDFETLNARLSFVDLAWKIQRQ